MPRLIRKTLDDVYSDLPNWAPYNPHQSGGLFVGAFGFENRACACLETWIGIADKAHSSALFVRYPTNQDDNKIEETRITDICRNHQINLHSIDYDRRSFYGELRSFLTSQSNVTSVTIDLSSLSSYLAFPVLEAFLTPTSAYTVDVVYAEAESYFPLLEEWEEFRSRASGLTDLIERAELFDRQRFQTRGVQHVYECPLFPGMNPDRLPSQLILVPNFSYERVHDLIATSDDKYSTGQDPNDFVWLFGVPPNSTKHGWRYEALREIHMSPTNEHPVATLDYKEVVKVLHDVWSKFAYSRSIILAPLGSKAQHLGCYLFLKMHPEVALLLSEPKEFIASRYSSGVGEKWQLHLGTPSDLQKCLSQWNQLTFEWSGYTPRQVSPG